MKQLLAFLMLAAAGSTSMAQTGQRAQTHTPTIGTLKPRRLIVGYDTLFAFKRDQVKELAKGIANSEFDKQEISQKAETIRAMQVKLEIQGSLIKLREKEIKTLEGQLAVRDSLLKQYQQQYIQDNAKRAKLEKQLTRQGWKNKLLGGLGMLVLLLLLIVLL